MSKHHVLTTDGGGIRGLVSTVLLQRLLVHPGFENLLDSVDLVAGTSTGGLLALGIAQQIDLADIRNVYVNKGPKIFDDSWLDDLADLGRPRGANYNIKPLHRELKKLLGKATLGQLKKHPCFVLFVSFYFPF
jgi:patatin-like phospholipase/acyl hydrolase